MSEETTGPLKIKFELHKVQGKENPINKDKMVIRVEFSGECTSVQWETVREKLTEGIEFFLVPDFQTQITMAMRSEIDDVKRENNLLKIDKERLKRETALATQETQTLRELLASWGADLGLK